ncbi:DNA-dependent RNA polymerase II [Sarracenia purpurea var. burkii]
MDQCIDNGKDVNLQMHLELEQEFHRLDPIHLCTVSTGFLLFEVFGLIKPVIPQATKIFVNGCSVGIHRMPELLVKTLRQLRRQVDVNTEVGVIRHIRLKELRLYTDCRRCSRPLFIVVKPFLEPKTANKVKFVYSNDPLTKKIMEDLFDMDELESAFGGKSIAGFDINNYAEKMKEDDKKTPSFWETGNACEAAHQPSLPTATRFDPSKSESDMDNSDEKADRSSSHEGDAEPAQMTICQ